MRPFFVLIIKYPSFEVQFCNRYRHAVGADFEYQHTPSIGENILSFMSASTANLNRFAN